LKAWELLKPKGILVSILSPSPFFCNDKLSQDFRGFLDRNNAAIKDFSEGEFKESGTAIRTKCIKMIKTPDHSEKDIGFQSSPHGKGLYIEGGSKMEAVTIKIPVGKILYSTDRKYGGVGNIETLAQSIDQHGLIQPIAVKEDKEKKGHYRIIAGRRRFEAVKSLKWKNIEATVYDDKADEAAIALAENVNREEMHPLDEAETFRLQIEAGKTVDEVAKYYARSVSAINHRIRLTKLIDGIKMMFRDGKVNLSGAALIASLPSEDQEKFLKKYENKLVNQYDITGFMRSVQKNTLEYVADKKCEKCKNRTHNTLPGLFEGFDSLEDVCFDGDCYAKKWQDFIGGFIANIEGDTENNIILDRGLPEFVSKKTKTITIGGVEYNLIPANGHTWNETKKKGKAKTAWLVSRKCNHTDGSYSIQVTRVAYEKSELHAVSRPGYEENPVKDFMIDQAPDVNEENQKAVAEKVKEKYQSKWRFESAVKESVLNKIITKKVIEGSEENLAALYLEKKFSCDDDDGNYYEIDPDSRNFITSIFGEIKSFSEIPKEPMTQKIFLSLIIADAGTNSIPDLKADDDDWAMMERSIFWKFIGMTKEEYIALFKETIKEKISAIDQVPNDEPAPEETSAGDGEDVNVDIQEPLGDDQ
jgi:ParB/RepB/Spo0J family partition protein